MILRGIEIKVKEEKERKTTSRGNAIPHSSFGLLITLTNRYVSRVLELNSNRTVSFPQSRRPRAREREREREREKEKEKENEREA